MKHSLTICMITGREGVAAEWFLDSLKAQILPDDRVGTLVFVDALYPECEFIESPCPGTPSIKVITTSPKPTIWQGEHRKTAVDWWAAANARNTGLCLAATDWIAWVDDRCVLGPQWLQSIRDAMEGGYAVFGAYEKRHGMKVENGVIVEPGTTTGVDHRIAHVEANLPAHCPGNWCYGCSVALPVEWALSIGGFEQAMDGMSFEDVIFGLMIQNNGWTRCYDPRFMIIEDRSPEACGKTYRREDKGVSPNDKSHRSLELFGGAVQTTNRHQLWQSRQAVQAGKPWPLLFDSTSDWYDGETIDQHYFDAQKP